MMRKLIAFVLIFSVFSVFAQNSKKKIGLVLNIEGPYKTYKSAVYNATAEDKSVAEKDKFYDVIQFLGTEKGNPLPRLKDFYIKTLQDKGFDVQEISEEINDKNFSKFTNKQKGLKFYEYDIRSLKDKYNLDEIIVIKGIYGLEVEMIGYIGGDKRTRISFSNYLVNTNTNILEKEFAVGNIKNIRKKDLVNPPDYPNVTESMDKLLTEKIFPDLLVKLQAL